MSCFHCVWDFNSVLSDKDQMLNFTLINDLSSNKAYVPCCICLSALSVFSSRANGVLLCMDVLCQACLIHRHFPPTFLGLKILQTWKGEWHLLTRICQAWSRRLRSSAILWQICVGCCSINHGVSGMQQKSQEQDGLAEEPHDLAVQGIWGFSMTGVVFFSPLCHERSVKCNVSFDCVS